MRRPCGFTLVELMITIGLFAILVAIAIPMLLTGLESSRLTAAARSVQSELQNARLRAVSANRPIRVRFNCPSPGQFRAVELIGTPSVPDAADAAANRCSDTTYPYPAADRNPLTRPNVDGPVRRLKSDISFAASQTIEFWPDGTAHADAGNGTPWPAIVAASGVPVTVQYKTSTKSITVNGVGKVRIQ